MTAFFSDPFKDFAELRKSITFDQKLLVDDHRWMSSYCTKPLDLLFVGLFEPINASFLSRRPCQILVYDRFFDFSAKTRHIYHNFYQ